MACRRSRVRIPAAPFDSRDLTVSLAHGKPFSLPGSDCTQRDERVECPERAIASRRAWYVRGSRRPHKSNGLYDVHPPLQRRLILRRFDIRPGRSCRGSQRRSRAAFHRRPPAGHTGLFRAFRYDGRIAATRDADQEVVPSQEGSTDCRRFGRPEEFVPPPRTRLSKRRGVA